MLSPPGVEMLGYLGFDWILLDNEHGSITVDTAEGCIAAAELTGMAPIVRPVGNKPEIIAPFLDRGAWQDDHHEATPDTHNYKRPASWSVVRWHRDRL